MHERIRDIDPNTFTTSVKNKNSLLDKVEQKSLKNVWFYDKDGRVIHSDKTKRDIYGRIVSEHDGERYAKVEFYSDDSKRMYIKFYSGGRVKGEYVVDPNTFEGNSNELYQVNEKYGVRLCEYDLVDEEMFAQYTFYLQTKNPSRIRDVERKYLDGR